MKKILITVVFVSLTGFANANLFSPAQPLNLINPASPLYALDDDESKQEVEAPDKKEIRQVYIHKTKKMTYSYNHTWFYDYKNQKYLMQKTTANVKAKSIMNVTYNITKNHYEL